jgi:hypothetical protein
VTSAGASELLRPFLEGWELVTTPAALLKEVCVPAAKGVLEVAGKPSGYFCTLSSHANYRLHAEWRWTGKAGNSGILVHISSGPKDRIWPLCYQVQFKNKSVGDLLPMAGASFTTPLTTPPEAKTPLRAHEAPDSERPAGEWNSCEVTCRGDSIEVSVNGVPQNRVTGCSLQSGRVGIQLEGEAFELRNFTLDPL